MPTPPPSTTAQAAEQLRQLGTLIRQRRKALRISAVAAAEAAGLSRVTLHRIEKGEPSVTMGAYFNTLHALGLRLAALPPAEDSAQPEASIPVRIAVDRYPQLARLAWQLHGDRTLTPAEALDIYERNARHLDLGGMDAAERALLEHLRAALGRGTTDV